MLGLLAGLCRSGGAQIPLSAHTLGIGDVLPDVQVGSFLRYPTSLTNLRALHKPIILDFFATWCGSCIAALPSLDALQKRLGDSVQVFVVDYEPVATVKSFLVKNHVAAQTSLPFICDDSVLSYLFPHKLIPHDVWIDRTGKVAAITSADELNYPNIRKLIAGIPLHLREKKDVMDFDRNRPLLQDGNGGTEGNLLYRSLLTRYLPGLFSGGGASIHRKAGYKMVYYINASLLTLYRESVDSLSPNRFILDLKDKSRFFQGEESWSNWAPTNAYSYELSLPISATLSEAKMLLLQDLNRYLHLNGHLEQRMVSCLALQYNANYQPSSISLIDNKQSIPTDTLPVNDLASLLFILNNQPFSDPPAPIFVNEIHGLKNIHLALPASAISDTAALRNILQIKGITFHVAIRRMNMFVISEN